MKDNNKGPIPVGSYAIYTELKGINGSPAFILALLKTPRFATGAWCKNGVVFEQRRKKEKQSEFWIATSQLPKATPSRFYELVDRKLEEIGFAERVYELCKPAYAGVSEGGRPGH